MNQVCDTWNFPATLELVVSQYGALTAFRTKHREVTYSELGAIVDMKVRAYRASGVGPGSPVGVIADDVVEFLADVYALLTLEAFAVLLSADMTAWEFQRLSKNVRLGITVSRSPMSYLSKPAVAAGNRFITRVEDDVRPILKGGAVGYLTSGTTGQQKVAIRTAEALFCEAMAMGAELDLVPTRRIASIIALHHSFGFGVMGLAAILAGAEVWICDQLLPSGIQRFLQNSSAELVPLVPAQLRLLAQVCDAPVFKGLSVLSAGVSLDVETAIRASERLGCAIGQAYGSTETGIMTVAAPGEGIDNVGKPSCHMELRLDPLPGAWETVGDVPGKEGIVAVRTRALFEGYVTADGIDSSQIEQGWFSTGDRARIVNNRVQLLGRISTAINVAGVKISPEEIEAAILEYPGIQAALVQGVYDAQAYQRLKAFVAPADVDIPALKSFCEDRLSALKRPQFFAAVDNLAMTPSGKVIRSCPIGSRIGGAPCAES